MGSTRARLILLAAVALVLAGAADASALSRQRVGVVPSASYAPAMRTRADIDRIVVHVGEGSFWGTVKTLRDPRREASAHYVVSQEGEVVQLVSPRNVAWHSGNRRMNERSIGIEHEGFTYEQGTVTGRELDASARLVAYLAARWGIPVDRKHVIGHDEVPDPLHRGLLGGADHHTDPGPFWPWKRYLALVRRYARSPQQPRFETVSESLPRSPRERRFPCFRRSIHSSTLGPGNTVSSLVVWRARACGRSLVRVDFLVDGTFVRSDGSRPYATSWNTTHVSDGWHRLTLRAHGPRGYRIRTDFRVRVENRPFELSVGGVEAGETVVDDTLELSVSPTAPARSVELSVDGSPVAVQTAKPFRFEWTAADAAPGTHELELRARAWDRRTTVARIPVEVARPLLAPAVAALLYPYAS
ncbi:MAG TPA: N-acetylmuramoyl-L-alanine amidase [Gaiellaceae bacterium]|nr:N-acetylmuramoyl-L-alanine amidase [Gaiellaceae bacterium]